MLQTWLLPALIFLVALLYSSVGHGGASGYLAVLSLFHVPPDQMATMALVLNIFVAGIAWCSYTRAGHFSWRLTWPFMIGSVPAAFLGGALHVNQGLYEFILGGILLYAAVRILIQPHVSSHHTQVEGVRFYLPALALGALIGLVSGLIGIGGGIFLSPVLLLLGWADLKEASATSALFIVVNAVSGLLGRLTRHALVLHGFWPLLVVGILGGILGSTLGSHKLPSHRLRLLLALVLILAGCKLLVQVFILWGIPKPA